jgi:tetratricopeptide (TPR) repeat protein
MHTILKYLMYLVLLTGWSAAIAADAGELFLQGNRLYQQNDFSGARAKYAAAAKEGKSSSALYYNIGNCYYKEGKLGLSILNYERAARLSPDDEDIRFNLRLASLKTVDKIETVPPVIYRRWILSVTGALSLGQWSVLCLSLAWAAFVAWGLYLYARSVAGKKAAFIAALALSVLATIAGAFAGESHRQEDQRQFAIVLSPSSYVKSSPDDKGNDQFILHEGSKAEVLDVLGDWNKIRISNGSVGWIQSKDLEVI